MNSNDFLGGNAVILFIAAFIILCVYLGVRIVPVGLHYVERDKFLSDVLVQYGDPIDPSIHFAEFREDQEAAARARGGMKSCSRE